MIKEEALLILIKNSTILSEQVKTKLTYGLSAMTQEEIDNLGRLLSMEVKIASRITK